MVIEWTTSDYADDIDVIEQSNEKLQEQWEIAGYSRQVTYKKWTIWNAYKCSKDKDHGLWKKPEENDAKVNIDGQAIENVKSFIYLESEFTCDNDCSKDIQRLL